MAYPDNVVRFYVSDMILHSFSDFLSESHSRSRAGGLAFYGWRNNPERINGLVLTSSQHARQIVWLRIVAAALGHPQPTSPTIHVDNTTCVSTGFVIVLGKAKYVLSISQVKDNWLTSSPKPNQYGNI